MSWFVREKIVEVERIVEVEKIVERIVETVIDKPVIGDAQKVEIYRAVTMKYVGDVYPTRVLDKDFGYFLSCAEAYASDPKVEVCRHHCIRVGEVYFRVAEFFPIKVNKPKVLKGRTKATKVLA